MSSVLELVEERARLRHLELTLETLHTPCTLPTHTTHTHTQPQHSHTTLLRSLLPHIPHQDFIDAYLASTEHLSSNDATRITEQVLSSIQSVLHSADNVWSDEEVVCVGAWLCAASAGGGAGGGRATRRLAARTLCSLLEHRATAHQRERLAAAVRAARWDGERAVCVRDATCGALGGVLQEGAGGVRAATRLVVSRPAAARDMLHALRHEHARDARAHNPDDRKMMSNLAMLEHFLNVTDVSGTRK